MNTTQLARRLSLDGNPLRRRTDKIAARLAALLAAVFLVGGAMLPGPPPGHRAGAARQAAAAVLAVATLGIVLLCLACTGRRVLDRRRLADWEAAWATVGPQWTRRFRSRG